MSDRPGSRRPVLERARKDAATLGVEVDYILGDMREIAWDQVFDGGCFSGLRRSAIFPKRITSSYSNVPFAR